MAASARTSATAPEPRAAWRNRIVESGEEAPDQLPANPANWRVRPRNQQNALAGALCWAAARAACNEPANVRRGWGST